MDLSTFLGEMPAEKMGKELGKAGRALRYRKEEGSFGGSLLECYAL